MLLRCLQCTPANGETLRLRANINFLLQYTLPFMRDTIIRVLAVTGAGYLTQMVYLKYGPLQQCIS